MHEADPAQTDSWRTVTPRPPISWSLSVVERPHVEPVEVRLKVIGALIVQGETRCLHQTFLRATFMQPQQCIGYACRAMSESCSRSRRLALPCRAASLIWELVCEEMLGTKRR